MDPSPMHATHALLPSSKDAMLNYCVFVVTGLTYTIYPFVYIQRLQACSRDYLRDSPCDRLWAAFLASTLFHDDFGPPFILFVFIFDCRLLPKVLGRSRVYQYPWLIHLEGYVDAPEETRAATNTSRVVDEPIVLDSPTDRAPLDCRRKLRIVCALGVFGHPQDYGDSDILS